MKRNSQMSAGKENLYYFYRFVVLKWELEWFDKKLYVNEVSLKTLFKKESLNIKSFDSTLKLNTALEISFTEESKTLMVFFGLLERKQNLKIYCVI